MSADEETFYNMKRLHAVFALSAVAFLAATVWALWSDARRPWKQYQQTFHDRLDRGVRPAPRLAAADRADFASGPARGQPLSANLAAWTAARRAIWGSIERRGRRGEGPYRAHPRLDLFVGEDSPHPMSRFGCTVCHEGQGSATDFAWAGHTPNDVEQAARWRQQYGWFRNPHWDFPMLPRAFSRKPLPRVSFRSDRSGADASFSRSAGGEAPGGLSSGAATGLHGLPREWAAAPFWPRGSPGRASAALSKGWTPPIWRTASAIRPASSPARACRAIYGLYEHLAGQTLAEAQRREELEIRGIVEYLIGPSEATGRRSRQSPSPFGRGPG